MMTRCSSTAPRSSKIADPKKSKQTVTYTNGRSKADNGLWPGFGQVTPIRINYKGVETQGFGRFHCLQEIGTMTICCADGTGGDNRPGGMYPDIQDPGVYEWDTTNIIKPSVPANENTAEYSNYPPLHQNIVPSPKDSDIVVANPATTQTNFMPRTSDGDLFNNTIFPTWPSWLIRLYWRYGTVAGKAAPNSVPTLPIAADNFVRETAIAPGDPGYKNEPILVPAEVMRAFETKRWNWNLAWLDPKYSGAMTLALEGGGGGVTRYDRKNLSGPGDFSRWRIVDPCRPGQSPVFLTRKSSCNLPCSFNLRATVWDTTPSIPTSPSRSKPRAASSVLPLRTAAMWSSPPTAAAPSNLTEAFSGNGIPKVGKRHTPTTLWEGRRTSTICSSVTTAPHFSYTTDTGAGGATASGRRTPLDLSYQGVKKCNQYPFVTRPYLVTNNQLAMNKGGLVVSIYSAGVDTKENKNSDPKVAQQQLVQQVEIEMDGFTARAPDLAAPDVGYWLSSAGPSGGSGRLNAMSYWSMGYEGANPVSAPYGRIGLLASRHNLDLLGDDRGVRVDVIRGVGIRHGDSRIVMTRPKITEADGIFVEHIDYAKADARIAMFNDGSKAVERRLNQFSNTNNLMYLDEAKNVQLYGDFDNGLGQQPDGPWINKPDEGNLWFVAGGTGGIYGNIPYFSEDWNQQAVTPSYFTPNRIVCSPVAFGSLPRRAKSGKPWETLLFRPNVTGGLFTTHPGAEDPPDHLLLDMFWMPVVEPFAISEPLSTGGKVNLNQDMLPFRHITRDTALLGVFKSEYMVVIPDLWKGNYKTNHGYGKGWHWKNNPYGGEMVGVSLRAVIEPTGTLDQFHEKFKEGKIFKTASEICDIHLVPISIGATQQSGRDNGITTPHWKQMGNGTYWSINRMTGDNAKEKPYNNIYPRITTKSNTFKVHYRAQILTKAKVTAPDEFDPEIDQVVAEYRGSSIVERYVEPNDPDIPDYASASSTSGSSGSTVASWTNSTNSGW
ncbi:MAG: Verru_Chthon cassette protein A [Verrucomicrobiales bacterium]